MNLDDTPAARIARLDASLERRGQGVSLRRRIGKTDAFVTLPMRVRISGYAVEELPAGVSATESKFIASPSAINAAFGSTWPAAAGGDRWPKIGDQLIVGGRPRQIVQVLPIDIGDVVVRIEGRIEA